MERIHGESELHSDEGRVDAHMRMSAGGADRSDFSSRASDFAGRVRDSVRDGLHNAGGVIEERTGVVDAIRRRPLAAIGIAFAAGFTLAAITEPSERNWAVERARRRVRAAIISGLTGILAQELRSILGSDAGLGEFAEAFAPDDEDEPDYDAFDL